MEKRIRFFRRVAYAGVGILIMTILSALLLGDNPWPVLRVLLGLSAAMITAGTLLTRHYQDALARKKRRRK